MAKELRERESPKAHEGRARGAVACLHRGGMTEIRNPPSIFGVPTVVLPPLVLTESAGVSGAVEAHISRHGLPNWPEHLVHQLHLLATQVGERLRATGYRSERLSVHARAFVVTLPILANGFSGEVGALPLG